jgi:hypothetical protein
MCYKKSISIILLALIIFSCGFLVKPQKAEAVVNPLAAISVPIYENGSLPYEMRKGIAGSGLGLDTVGWIAAKLVISTITNSIVNWINSGFEGNPTFVQNPQQFLSDAANQAGGVFIQQLGLTQLCNPNWLPKLKLALQYNTPYLQRMQCTPDMVKTNIENFTNDFMNGGWDSWLSMTSSPQNNIWGAYFESSDELARRQAAATAQAQMEASWGQGFMSLKKCAGGNTSQDYFCTYVACAGATSPAECRQQCMETSGTGLSTSELCQLSGGQMQNTTPGNIIADQLKVNLGSSVRQLEAADEINESLAAIFNALINQLISKGLSSLSNTSGSSSSGGWYSTSPTTQEKNDDITIINNALSYEVGYRDAKQNSVNAYKETINKLELLKSCYQGRSMVNQTRINEIQAQINDYGSKKVSLQSEVDNSNDLINQAEALKTEISNASTYTELESLLNKFMNEIQPKMHNAAYAENTKTEYESIKNILIQKNNEIDAEYNQCLSGV